MDEFVKVAHSPNALVELIHAKYQFTLDGVMKGSIPTVKTKEHEKSSWWDSIPHDSPFLDIAFNDSPILLVDNKPTKQLSQFVAYKKTQYISTSGLSPNAVWHDPLSGPDPIKHQAGFKIEPVPKESVKLDNLTPALQEFMKDFTK